MTDLGAQETASPKVWALFPLVEGGGVMFVVEALEA
tara:strand:+ start:303 stop:410 length:108 start_codon:yes stop_codon:yes gene_type:complete